ncbi:hypothetical protein [Neorhizobium tomejilense]|uniref:hypothetical protein n=1 Tax=Neorhizobium tomejilense TaxID=2093828 RepID=UPI003ECF0E2C
MSENTWREITPHFRVDHDTDYSFAEIERRDGETKVWRHSFRSNPACRTAATMDDVLDRLRGYSDEIHGLLSKSCGVTIEKSSYSQGIVIVRIYQQDRSGLHLVYRDPAIRFIPSWLRNVLDEWLWDEVESAEEAVTGKRRPQRHGKPAEPEFADVAAAELTPSLPDIQTRISALKGVFALATGQYDDVSEADIQAATAGGYGNPEVLRGVKEATWLMVEAHRGQAWSQGYDKGYEAKAAVVAEYAKVAEGVTVPSDYTMISVLNTEPPTDLPIDEYKAEMRSLHLRQQRAETLRSELKAGQLIEDIGEPWVNDYLFSARNWGGPDQKADMSEAAE